MDPEHGRRVDTSGGVFRAKLVAEELELASPMEASIEAIAYLRKAIVRVARMEGSLARLVKANGRALITVSDKLSHEQRRFAVAHELGHHELHGEKDSLALCTGLDLQARNKSLEGEANAFAVELLMPSRLLQKRFEIATPSLEHASRLASEYQVSFTAAALRFVELSSLACALVRCEGSKVVWCIKGKEFRGFLRHGSAVEQASLAYEFFAGKPIPKAPEEVSPESWIAGRTRSRLIEHSMVAAGGTLSLLWQPAS